MSVYRLLLRSSAATTSCQPLIRALHYLTVSPTSATGQVCNSNDPIPLLSNPTSSSPLLPTSRTYAFSSAEEAAAERRRRKRRLRIEPPLHALQRNPNPPPRDPNAPRLPDSTSALVGPRLNLHNRVQSLIRAFDLDNASLLARNSIYTRTRPTVFTCNAIIAAMYRAKRYNDAIALFKYFFEQHDIIPNVVSYNNLINAHCDEGRVDTGLEIYRHIIATAPFSPSPVTYRHLTKGLIDAGRTEEAVDLLREMLNRGHGADSLVYNNLIKAFLELGNLEKANEFFSELTERCLWYDGTINATFMDWWFKQEKDKEALENYKSFMDKKLKIPPPTGNALLEVLLRYGKKEAAVGLFELMLDNHTPPTNQGVNSETFNIMVNECFKEQNFTEATQTFRKTGTKVGSKPFQMDVAGYNNIIVRFCENEMLSEAEQFFTELMSKSLSPDVTSYRTLIDAYLKVERIDDALTLLNKMVQENLWVVANYATRVFSELIKNGKGVDCAQILTKMGDRDPKPDPSVYDVVVRGLCDAGAFDTSKDILEQMMRYGVGIPPALKEFVRQAFTNVGQSQEIECALDESRWRNISGPPRVQRQPRMPWAPPQMARDQPLGPSSLSGQPPMLRQQPFDHQQMARQMPSGAPPMTGEQPLGSHSTLEQHPSAPHQTGGQQASGPHQIAGQQSSWSSQAGQQPSWSSQAGQQQSWSSQAGQPPSWSSQTGQPPSWSSQTGQQPSWSFQGGQQQPLSSQTGEQQPLASHNIERQQSSRPYQMAGQQPSWPSQTAGQQQPLSSQTGERQPFAPHNIERQQSSRPYQMAGQQPSWPSQTAGQQQPLSSQTGERQPFAPHNIERQQSSRPYQMAGQQPSWPSQTAGQQQPLSSQMGERQPFAPHNIERQQSSRPYQMAGQQPSWPSQTEGQQPSRYSQMGGQQLPQFSQLGGQKLSQYSQIGGQQPSWSSQMGAPQPSGTTHMTGHQPHGSQQMSKQLNPEVENQLNGSPEMAGHHSSESLEWQNNHKRAAA